MSKRMTDTDKYKKPFIRGLKGPYKLLWDYLYHDCNHAGIWIADFEIAQIYIGSDMQINKKDALIYFNEGEKRIVEFNKTKWFLPSFIEFQYGILNENNRVHKSVIDILIKNKLYDPSKGLIRGLQDPKDKDKDKDKVKEKDKGKEEDKDNRKIIPPKLEWVGLYFIERKCLDNSEHNKFFDFYESKGWFVGKSKMKDWKASVRNWLKGKSFSGNNSYKSNSSFANVGTGNEMSDPVPDVDMKQHISERKQHDVEREKKEAEKAKINLANEIKSIEQIIKSEKDSLKDDSIPEFAKENSRERIKELEKKLKEMGND